MQASESHPNAGCASDKILLLLLPYWTPFIPPLGLACLKSVLVRNGFAAKTIDANVEPPFMGIYKSYVNRLQSFIVKEQRGNYYNIVNDVLRDHLMAYLRKTDHLDYAELLRLIIYRNFYVHVSYSQVEELDQIVSQFYAVLEARVVEWIRHENPNTLGISVLNGTLPASLHAFKIAKERFPSLRTVMGGGVFTGELAPGSPNFARLVEQTPYIDKIIVGEGEHLFLRYLRGELPFSERVFLPTNGNGEALDLTSALAPDLSDFSLDYYPNLVTYASRGCPFQCSFCSETNLWGVYRKRPVEQVVAECSWMKTRYGRQTFLLADSLLNPVLGPLSGEMIRTQPQVYIDGYVRADRACSEENASLWRRAGLYRARIGAESGSDRVLQLMNKRVDVEQIRRTVSHLAQVGIKTTTYWVIGHPGETEEDFRLTLDLIGELKTDLYEVDCNPFNYYFNGQSNSRQWWAWKGAPLYPEDRDHMLMVQTWVLDTDPSRQVAYERVNRFVEHCRRLGIPNPYTLYEIHQADKRWQSLHENAVPPLTKFMRC